MAADITAILCTLVMESSDMNIHDFVGNNLIFTIVTGNHFYIIPDGIRLIVTIMILIIYWSFP